MIGNNMIPVDYEIEKSSYTYYKLIASLSDVDIFSSYRNAHIFVARSWTPEYFLWCYNTIGHDYKWWYFNYKTDLELYEYLNDPTREYLTFMNEGKPSGIAIIKYEDDPAGLPQAMYGIDSMCNLEYFGLFPDSIGRGVGKQFLDSCLTQAALRATTMWVYTTSLDHPAALRTYKSVGFQITERRIVYEYFPQLC